MRARSSHKNPAKRIFYTTLFFALVILFGLLLPRAIHFVGAALMTPVHVLNEWYETSESTLPVLLREKNDLQAQIDTLKNDLAEAQGEDLTLVRLQDENSRLRALLGVGTSSRVAARIIARPNDIPYDLLQIDQGANAGVKQHSLVYIGSDQVIGSVLEVRNNYSFVELFTTPGVEMTGFISGPDVVATVEGVGGGVARVRVPQGIPLNIGDLVYVPSIHPGLFGQIDHVENRPSQPEQFGYITLPISLQSISEVAVDSKEVPVANNQSIQFGVDSIINERMLVESANTVSFEELLATSTASSTDSAN